MSQDFQTTRWTLIFEAAKTDFKNSGPALESLCQAYWMPLYTYARRSGKSHEDAQDSIQAFFEYLLKKNLPALADKKRGRFRSFLLSTLQLFLLREYRHSTTLKRGGAGSLHIPFDEALDGLNHFSDTETPEAAFERKWAHTLVNHALEQLSSEQASSGHGERFQLIRVLLLDPTNENEVRLRLRSDHGMTEGASAPHYSGCAPASEKSSAPRSPDSWMIPPRSTTRSHICSNPWAEVWREIQPLRPAPTAPQLSFSSARIRLLEFCDTVSFRSLIPTS